MQGNPTESCLQTETAHTVSELQRSWRHVGMYVPNTRALTFVFQVVAFVPLDVDTTRRRALQQRWRNLLTFQQKRSGPRADP